MGVSHSLGLQVQDESRLRSLSHQHQYERWRELRRDQELPRREVYSCRQDARWREMRAC